MLDYATGATMAAGLWRVLSAYPIPPPLCCSLPDSECRLQQARQHGRGGLTRLTSVEQLVALQFTSPPYITVLANAWQDNRAHQRL
jgi:hypothetical protein